MLNADEIILDVLNTAKSNGNKLLQYFHISYPDKQLAQENNCIFVACVSSENELEGFDFEQFRDLVEILIVTKQDNNRDAINIIKTVSFEICKLIMENTDQFPNRPVIRNVNPFFDVDLILTRGQIMVNVNTEPVDFNVSEDMIENVCNILIEDIIEK